MLLHHARSKLCLARAGLGVAALLLLSAGESRAAKESVLYGFTETAHGSNPYTGVIADSHGALYGTTEGGGTNFESSLGTVFKLTPPEPGKTAWTETVLYTFTGGASGGIPKAGLVMDADGALYGTTYQGGQSNCDFYLGCGTVFKLTPPAKGKKTWTEKALHIFTGSMQGVAPNGIHPWGALALGPGGVLFGTTLLGGTADPNACLAQGCGTVFKLTPPAKSGGAWTETVLHRFTNSQFGYPHSGVTLDAKGDLFGTAAGGGLVCCGLVYELTAPAKGSTTYTYRTLHAFTGSDGARPQGGLAIDTDGKLYGTTYGDGSDNYGTVFRLTPPAKSGGTWSNSVLVTIVQASLGGPIGAPTLASNGTLYFSTGSDSGGTKEFRPNAASETPAGVVVKLTPPSAGHNTWTHTILHSFQTTGDGADPPGPLLLLNGALYGTTTHGWNSAGSVYTNGTVFKIASP